VSGLQTEAGTIVVLAPDWRRPLEWLPPLAAYVVAAPLDGDTCLALDVRDSELSLDVVAGLIERACGYISEGQNFAEVLIVVDDVDLPEPVTSVAELVERLGLDVRPLGEDPATVVLHARWVKALADDLQSQVDRALLAAARPVRLEGEPLVTVRIPTYGSVDLLLERAIPSVLAGGYRNVEVLVCSDGPQPHARQAVEAHPDPRVRYLELPERPVYAQHRPSFWQVAGTAAVNHMLDEAAGEVIAPLDHDDAFTMDHIPVLLRALQAGADFAYGQAMTETPTGTWWLLGSAPLQHGRIVHASVMYTRRLGHMRHDPEAWIWDEPGDWNMWRRMRDAGAEIVHVPHPIALHFKEGSSIADREQEDPGEALASIAADVRDTAASALLEVASHARGATLPGRAGGRAAAPPRRPEGGRLAVIDTTFPLRLSGFRYEEAQQLLGHRPDTVFFTMARTGESWPRPVYPISAFSRLAAELGITDVYFVFLNLAVSLLGLRQHPGAAGVGGIPPDAGVARVISEQGIRAHTTLYPGGGLVAHTDPSLLRAVASRCANVFTNAQEVLDAVPEAQRIPGPIDTTFYAYRPRDGQTPFRVAFAAADRPRKGLDTVITAFAGLGDDIHLHLVGPHERYLGALRPGSFTYHGWLEPDELRGVYWACDAFVSPVRPEGAGAAPGEEGVIDGFPTAAAADALAAGCALISSNPRADHSVLQAGEHYLEIAPDDPLALAEAIQSLAADRDRRDALAERGSARLRELMDVERVAQAKLAAMGLVAAAQGQ
jgi:glycosyltransferase involved in cell wall biosynthesis